MAHPATVPGPTQVLLVEDDDADALLVEELLLDAAAPVALRRARSLAEAKPLLPGVTCVLLDLGLPDTGELQELRGVRWLAEHMPDLAVVVLTGVADEHLGAEAVRAGAQDYLVKGQVDGALLNRVIRYAIERLRSEEVQRQLREAGCTRWSGTSAGAARKKPLSAFACGWPGAPWCWPAGRWPTSYRRSSRCWSMSATRNGCSPRCA